MAEKLENLARKSQKCTNIFHQIVAENTHYFLVSEQAAALPALEWPAEYSAR
jgi:hypothetical protein